MGMRTCFVHLYLSVIGSSPGIQHSILFSCSIMSNFATHGLQHARLPCPSPSPGTCSNSCPLSWWCHPTILSSVVPFSYWLQSFLASGSFPLCQLFVSDGQKYWSFSFSISPSNIYLGLTGLISLLSKGVSGVFCHTAVGKHQLVLSFLYGLTFTSIHDYWKNHSFD